MVVVVVAVGGLVGAVVAGGEVVGGGDLAGGDVVTTGVVVGDERELPLPVDLGAVGDVVLGLVLGLAPVAEPVAKPVPELAPVLAPPVEVALDTGLTADDFPSESTANHSFSTPCPVAWPFFVSRTKWYSA